MSHSRNHEHSRKGIDDLREIKALRTLSEKASREEPDLAPIVCFLSKKTKSTINVINDGSRLLIVLAEETVHVRLIS